MHELGIVQEVVDAIAERAGDAHVHRVTLEIGPLSGLAPDAVRLYFELVAQGTALEGARLEILEATSGRELRVREIELV
jgi:hydrogenase nickel incorporation protein HypA/HybF